jgi:hypothetical protein
LIGERIHLFSEQAAASITHLFRTLILGIKFIMKIRLKQTYHVSIALALLTMSACDTASTPATGKSYADAILKKDVLNIAPTIVQAMTDCDSSNIPLVATKALTTPNAGSWNEVWTFKACDQLVNVPIAFFKKPNVGGVFFNIQASGITPA